MPKGGPEIKQEVKTAWREAARELARKDVKEAKLSGKKAEEYFYQRVTYHYKKLKANGTKTA